MNQYDRTNVWGSHSPLMSLTGLALIVAASGRFSCSAAACLLLIGINALSLSIIHIGKTIIPHTYKTALSIVIVTFVTSLFYLVIDVINPISALELYFIIFLIPIVFLSSHITQRTENLSPSEGIVLGIKESAVLGGFILAIALIREPLGYGTLSIPFAGRTLYFLSDQLRERVVLQVFALPIGGFMLTACLIALVRSLSFQNGTRMEDEND